MVKPARTPPASPRSSVVRKHFDKAPGSPGDELLTAAALREVPHEGRFASRTLHLQTQDEVNEEDVSTIVSDTMSNQSASSMVTGKSQRSAQSLRIREDLKLQVLRSRIVSLEAESRIHEMSKPHESRHCQIIAKLAAKKAEMYKLV